MSTALTWYFEDVIPDYSNWVEIMREDGNIVDYTKPVEASFDRFCYNLLARHFSHSNIRYEEESAFLLELVNIYGTKFKQFLKQKEIIDAVYNLTLDEIRVIEEGLSNLANNPNDEVSNPKEALNYISAQTYSLRQDGKLTKYLEALDKLPMLNTYSFINEKIKNGMSFNDLFMQILPNEQYLY